MVLIDFSFMRRSTGAQSAETEAGTTAYEAPKILSLSHSLAQSAPMNHNPFKADVWSLGVTL